MAISLDSIYNPIRDLFSQKFNFGVGSPMFFRFDILGSVISDEDFIDPKTNLCVSPEKARENFSDLVNQVTIENSDLISMEFSNMKISDVYFFRLLNPSSPFIPAESNSNLVEGILKSFGALKREATLRWTDLMIESSTGLMLKIAPSLPTPENWYDKNNGAWTNYHFTVTDTSPAPVDPANQLHWKIRVNEAVFQNLLNTHAEEKPDDNTNLLLKHKSMHLKSSPTNALSSGSSANVPIKTAMLKSAELTNKSLQPEAKSSSTIKYIDLSADKRIMLNKDLLALKPLEPVKTQEFTISFDWCVVNIQRPWLFYPFMVDKSWYVPNYSKGELSAKDNFGATMNSITTNFVAIKNLVISAKWNSDDIKASMIASDFGPFKVDPGITNMNLQHEGIQIIGWVLQKLPNLPPNSEPNVNTHP